MPIEPIKLNAQGYLVGWKEPKAVHLSTNDYNVVYVDQELANVYRDIISQFTCLKLHSEVGHISAAFSYTEYELKKWSDYFNSGVTMLTCDYPEHPELEHYIELFKALMNYFSVAHRLCQGEALLRNALDAFFEPTTKVSPTSLRRSRNGSLTESKLKANPFDNYDFDPNEDFNL